MLNRYVSSSAAGLAIALFATPGMSQSKDWAFSVTPYVWLPGVSTSIDTDRGKITADISANDAVAKLDMAFMGLLEARRGRWGFIADMIYLDLSESKDSPLGVLYDKAKVETTLSVFSGYAAYRMVEDPKAKLDLLGGFRVSSADVDISLLPGRLKGREDDLSETWAAPLIGIRGQFTFAQDWYANAALDVSGTGDDDLTWQAVAALGYRISDRWSLEGGWRYIDVEKNISGTDLDIEVGGPILGISARF